VAGPQPRYETEYRSYTGPSFVVAGWRDYAEYRLSLEPAPRVDIWLGEIDVRDALLGFMHAVLPLGLPLFGIEPLHGAAVARGDGSLLLLGPAGAGKSTLAAALERHGYAFMSDDACAIDEHGRVLPGPPLAAHYAPPPTHRALAPYEPKVLATPERARVIAARPARVVSLTASDGAEIRCESLTPSEAFREILGNVRAPSTLPALRVERQLRVAGALSTLPSARVRCDLDTHSGAEVAAAIAAWADGDEGAKLPLT
jgi:hypothetical protein